MNARSQLLELDVEGRQVEEAVLSLFHSVIFLRTTGKFTYKNNGTYSIGSVGFTDVECDYIDFTYVKCNADAIDVSLRRDVGSFCKAIRDPVSPSTGQISLEFYQRKQKRPWPFPIETIPWEVWNLKINLVKVNNENERQVWREKVGERLGEHLLTITDCVNRGDYLPSPPNQTELENIFDVSYADVQPYLYKVCYNISSIANPSMSTAVKKLLRDTLSFT